MIEIICVWNQNQNNKNYQSAELPSRPCWRKTGGPDPTILVFLWSVKAFIQESKFAHDYTSLSAPVHSEDVPILCEHLVCLRLVPGHRDHRGLGGIGGYLLFRFYTSNKYSVYNIHLLTVVKWFSKWGLRVLLVRRSPIPRQGRKRTSRKCRTRILATYQDQWKHFSAQGVTLI